MREKAFLRVKNMTEIWSFIGCSHLTSSSQMWISSRIRWLRGMKRFNFCLYMGKNLIWFLFVVLQWFSATPMFTWLCSLRAVWFIQVCSRRHFVPIWESVGLRWILPFPFVYFSTRVRCAQSCLAILKGRPNLLLINLTISSSHHGKRKKREQRRRRWCSRGVCLIAGDCRIEQRELVLVSPQTSSCTTEEWLQTAQSNAGKSTSS